eukprot:TRINITY_DN6602_c0_g2_i1.p1 TRINITY_DN6602_c0_g2~~TRINITY_DN6602_c0_g2_i1.p1  ORF type:complete len:198 (+),score=54.38 TRINITY_DN6602_c0_g2_i1:65-595(+)
MFALKNITKRVGVRKATQKRTFFATVMTREQIKSVMTKNVKLVGPDSTLQEAARKMKESDSGFLPIGKDDRLQGTVTDRDIVIRCVAEGADPKTTKVSQAMSNDLVYCFEDQDLRDAKKIMGEKQIRRLPVLNRDKRLVGVVSLGDISESSNVSDTVSKISKDTGKPSQTDGKKHP